MTRPNPEKSVTFVTFEFQTPTRVPQIQFFSEPQKTLILLVYHGYLTRVSRKSRLRIGFPPKAEARRPSFGILGFEGGRWLFRVETAAGGNRKN